MYQITNAGNIRSAVRTSGHDREVRGKGEEERSNEDEKAGKKESLKTELCTQQRLVKVERTAGDPYVQIR